MSFNNSYYAGSIIDYQNTDNINSVDPLIFDISAPNTSSFTLSGRRIKSIIDNIHMQGNGLFGFLFIIGY